MSENSICRVCRKCKDEGAPNFVSLFFKQEAEYPVQSIASMLEFVGSISVSENESNMPQEICVDCLVQLRASYRFRKLCMESDDLLRKQCMPKVVTASENGSSSSKQQQQQVSGNKHHAVHLHEYDPSFYQLAVDRYYYMELIFIARRCCGCRQAFTSSEELQAHSFSVHRKDQSGVAAHQCPICFSRFPYPDALHHHRQAVQSNVFCCRECYLMFEKKYSLFSHLRTEHHRQEFELEKELYAEEDQPMGHSIFDPDPEPNLLVSNVQSLADSNADPYLAGYCELSPDLRLCDLRPSQYRFTERTDRFSIIEFTWHRCCACNHMFMNQSDLEVHCTEEHRLRYNPTATVYMQSKPFMCQHCWRRFKKKSLLGLHQKFNRKKVYSCNTCLHIFFGGPAYEKHLPSCYSSNVDPGQVLSSTYADEAAYVGHQMMKEEPEEDDDDSDVYILND